MELLLVIGWVGYVCWVMRTSERARRAHLVIAWALLAAGVIIELLPLLR